MATKAPTYNPQNTPNPQVGRDAAQPIVSSGSQMCFLEVQVMPAQEWSAVQAVEAQLEALKFNDEPW